MGEAPLENLLRARVLQPWGMSDTAFYAKDISRLATAYGFEDGVFTVNDPQDGSFSRPPVSPECGSGLVSTIDDMLKFGAALLQGGAGVLTPSTVTAMSTNQLTADQRSNVWPGFNFL